MGTAVADLRLQGLFISRWILVFFKSGFKCAGVKLGHVGKELGRAGGGQGPGGVVLGSVVWESGLCQEGIRVSVERVSLRRELYKCHWESWFRGVRK